MTKNMHTLTKLRWMTVVAIVLFVLLTVSFLRVFLKDYELRREIERVQHDVQKLEKRKIESLEVLKRLQSDAYVEDRARAELQAAKPGEAVLVVPGLVVTSSVQSSLRIEEPQKEQLSNPMKWWYYFFQPSRLQQ